MVRNIAITCFALVAAILFFEFTPVDIAIQDYLYNFETAKWYLDKHAALPKLLFYDGVKKVFIAFAIGIFISLVFFRKTPLVKQYRSGLLIVLLSSIAVPLFIGMLKANTNIPCPKNIDRYGGKSPYVTALSSYPASFQQTKQYKCYPAGHASGGFALMSLFFLFSLKKHKKIALSFAITMGWTTGTYKMLIGDHFFSHTFTTMIIAWLVILLIVLGVNRLLPDWKKY